jgi:hypothetical protein
MRSESTDYLSSNEKVWTKKVIEMSSDLNQSSITINDPVNHPKHYTWHPSGIEVIQITEHMNFCLGNAIKYILRSDHKKDQIQDLEKAVWYINREIDRLKSM